MSIELAVVDDEALVRKGLRMILDAEPDLSVLGEAEDGEGAVRLVEDLDPDVLLMDIRMPGVDGLEATRQIEASGARTRVVMLTTFDYDEYIFDALRAGASAFLLKNAPPERLISAIRVVHAGEALLEPSVTRRLIEEFVRTPEPLSEGPAELEELTAKELEVMSLLARGLSNAEIAEELVVSTTTVKTHVAHILLKLGVRDRAGVVVKAYETGLVRPRRS